MLPKQVRYQLRYTRRKLEKPAPGGGTRARTADNPVKSRVLYQLSYAPLKMAAAVYCLNRRAMSAKDGNEFGIHGRHRTFNLRFWRPLLCPLSYVYRNLVPRGRLELPEITLLRRARLPVPPPGRVFISAVSSRDHDPKTMHARRCTWEINPSTSLQICACNWYRG